ncbi:MULTISPECIES: DUF1269 domain-containing protein [Enterococcus]|uniref:DUF1269 domain-containing protein n=1 Tax=Candidatus Enterococcus lemimoniae TaxID=1834167 RepID=A0ABZ2T2B4_9ENTE|nr:MULTISPECIES: DUF1269 domain-containing protein [unclassified Enterococcus]OTN90382.1 hypothetical protein A5819_002882 [Enterococcus sp. 7E2_DIV0204]OTO69242.1 hypothetical protein A5866_001442 [Enterococcus sp. 12C11_DIV0727]OTP52838.1 hypothetical protein A5884_002041 [Enterococcus sp. 7D2_DIV0200]
MSKRVIIMHFEVESQAYQAFSEIKKLYVEKKIKGEQMAVVTHINDGVHQFKIDDFLDFTGNNHTSKNSMIGMLIGILGGPLGILLGWFAGSLFGASQDAKEIQGAQTVFEHVTKQIGVGETGLILIAEEDDNRPLNQLIMNELGGEITRLDFEDVEKEITDAKAVEKETKDSAEKSWQDKKQDTSEKDEK